MQSFPDKPLGLRGNSRMGSQMKKLMVTFVSGALVCGVASSARAEEKSSKLSSKLPSKSTTTPAPTGEATNPAPETTDMPTGALFSTYQSELYEARKAEDAEREAATVRETTTQTQADLERQISQRKSRIEALKVKQEQIMSDLKSMETEVADYQKKFDLVQGDYTTAEEKHENFLANLEKEKADLETAKTKYDNALAQLNERHDRTQKAINGNLVQLNKEKVELAAITTAIQSLESQVASLEADEMKSRAEFMAYKSQTEEKKAEKAKKLALVTEAEKKYQTALNEQRAAQTELANAEKSLADTNVRVAADVRKYDESTMAAQRAKVIADTNKVRVEAEVEKLKTYLAMVKKANTEMMLAEHDSESNLMNAQLALEAAKSELAMNVSTGEQMGYRRAKQEAQMR